MTKHLILLNPKYDGYQQGLALMVYTFLIKRLDYNIFATRTRSITLATQNNFSDGAVKKEIVNNKGISKRTAQTSY